MHCKKKLAVDFSTTTKKAPTKSFFLDSSKIFFQNASFSATICNTFVRVPKVWGGFVVSGSCVLHLVVFVFVSCHGH